MKGMVDGEKLSKEFMGAHPYPALPYPTLPYPSLQGYLTYKKTHLPGTLP